MDSKVKSQRTVMLSLLRLLVETCRSLVLWSWVWSM